MRYRCREFFGVRHVQKLIGSVRIAFGAEHTAHHHLCFRKTLTEHVHQRNGAALPDGAAARAKESLRGAVERLVKPGRGSGCVPACGAASLKSHLGLVGRVVFEQRLELLHGLRGVNQRRQPQRELEGGVGPQHIAGVLQGRKALCAGHAERGPPGALQQGLHGVGGGGQREAGCAAAVVVRPGKTFVNFVAQNRCRCMRLRQPVGRHLAMKTGRQQTAGGTVFQPVQHLAHDAKARRHQPAGIARMNAFGQHLDFERARHHAAQAGGQPELVVVAGARVQADHQAHIAQPAAQRIHIGQQIVRAAFFAGLDQPNNARVRHLLAFQRLNGGDAGVGCVAVVSAAAAVELAVLVAGRPRAQVGAPAAELGLLVQVAIHQHRLRCLARHGRTGGRHFKKQHRRAAG